MANTYKIHSKFLNSINEALQKLSSNNEIKILKHPMLEADGNFTSIISSNEKNFDPSKINSNILVDKDEQSEDIIEKKNELTTKAIDKIKQTLDVSDELQSILNEIDRLNKDTDYNTWKVNEQQNTANLKSKNAYIFLQNDNICLSHDNQIEIFKSVNELHDWLKKHNYPLPKDIKLHESILNEDHNPIETYNTILSQFKAEQNNKNKKANNIKKKEDQTSTKTQKHINFLKNTLGKWYDIIYGDFTDMHGNKMGDKVMDNRTPEEKQKDYLLQFEKPNAYSKLSKEDEKLNRWKADIKLVKNPYEDIFSKDANRMVYNDLHWGMGDFLNKPKKKNKKESMNEDSFDTNNLWYLIYQNPSRNETFYLNNNWEEGNLLANNLQQAIVFLNREDAIEELKKLYNYKKTDYPFKPIQEKEFNECGVTCGSLGSAVQYTANKKDLQEEDLLDEMGRLAKGQENLGLYNQNVGKKLNKMQDAWRNADKDIDPEIANEIIKGDKERNDKEVFSRLLSNAVGVDKRFLNDHPDYFLHGLYTGSDRAKNRKTIVNKEKFINGLKSIINTMPEEYKFQPEELISKDNFENEIYDYQSFAKGNKDKWEKFKDTVKQNIIEPWRINNPSVRDNASKFAKVINIQNPERREEALKQLQQTRDEKDINKRTRVDSHGTTNLLNVSIPGARRNLITVRNTNRLKPLFTNYTDLANDGETEVELRDWLNDNIKNNKKLNDYEKRLLSYGILEQFTTKKEKDFNNPDQSIEYIPNLEDNDGYAAVRGFILKNKIKPLNAIDYLDDKWIQDMAFGEVKESSLKNEFLKLLDNKVEDITLTEDDDVPSDFATNIKSDMDSISSDTSTNTSEAPTTNDSDFDIDSSTNTGNSKPDVNFGDINIAGGTGDYGPEEDEEMSNMPIEPVDEYKIIDILVNDDNNEDIKVKVQNQTTGEIETKNLSEIDI